MYLYSRYICAYTLSIFIYIYIGYCQLHICQLHIITNMNITIYISSSIHPLQETQQNQSDVTQSKEIPLDAEVTSTDELATSSPSVSPSSADLDIGQQPVISDLDVELNCIVSKNAEDYMLLLKRFCPQSYADRAG